MRNLASSRSPSPNSGKRFEPRPLAPYASPAALSSSDRYTGQDYRDFRATKDSGDVMKNILIIGSVVAAIGYVCYWTYQYHYSFEYWFNNAAAQSSRDRATYRVYIKNAAALASEVLKSYGISTEVNSQKRAAFLAQLDGLLERTEPLRAAERLRVIPLDHDGVPVSSPTDDVSADRFKRPSSVEGSTELESKDSLRDKAQRLLRCKLFLPARYVSDQELSSEQYRELVRCWMVLAAHHELEDSDHVRAEWAWLHLMNLLLATGELPLAPALLLIPLGHLQNLYNDHHMYQDANKLCNIMYVTLGWNHPHDRLIADHV